MKKLGATGKFPQGSLGPHDEGELQFGIAHDKDGLVHVNFGKGISWFSMPPEVAINFARQLLKHAGIKEVIMVGLSRPMRTKL